MQNCNFKIKFSRTTKQSECISVKGSKMWNDMPGNIKLCKSMFTVIFFLQSFTFATLSIWLGKRAMVMKAQGRRKRERPKRRWLDKVKDDIKEKRLSDDDV